MTHSSVSASNTVASAPQRWDDLKQAIATSSGFQRWQLEHLVDEQLQDFSLEHRVRRYLRETLETLAY